MAFLEKNSAVNRIIIKAQVEHFKVPLCTSKDTVATVGKCKPLIIMLTCLSLHVYSQRQCCSYTLVNFGTIDVHGLLVIVVAVSFVMRI